MVGLMPNVLTRLILATAGKDQLAEIRRRAGIPVERKYDLNKVYPDEEWQRFYDATRCVLDLSHHQAEEACAEFFCRDALERWSVWFTMSRNSREMLVRQPAIHNTFSTGLQNPRDRAAMMDKFRLVETTDGLTTFYCSPNRLCGLYMALARWIVNYYGDCATIEEECCMKKGAAECKINIAWTRLGQERL